MYKIQQKAEIRGGQLIIDLQQLTDKATLLDDGHAVITVELINTTRSTSDFQRQYFRIRDTIATETGEGRKEVHEHIKHDVLRTLVTEPLYLNSEAVDILLKVCGEDPEVLRFYISRHVSTKWLNELGWKEFIEAARIWAFTGLNIHV